MTTERRRPDAVTAIAIYHFLEAAMALMVMLFVGFVAFIMLFAASNDPGVVPAIVVMAIIGFFAVLVLVANVAVGWGLLALQNWARWAAIILSVLRLPNFPIGTVIGGLIIYYLFQDEARAVFEGV